MTKAKSVFEQHAYQKLTVTGAILEDLLSKGAEEKI